MKRINQTLGFIALLLLLGLAARAAWILSQPKAAHIQGQIEARQYHVSSKIPGRLERILVHRGDQVTKGDLLFAISSPELEAKQMQAQAGLEAAKALKAQADNGARAQEVLAAKEQWNKAKAAAKLARVTYERVENLFDEGVVARQKRDEAFTQWQAANFTESAARAVYLMADEGARQETKDAAAGKAMAAQGQLNEVQAVLADSQMRAPRTGEVSQVMLDEGELAPSGFPVVTLVDMTDAWALFNVREDRLAEYPEGKQVQVRIPALNASFPFVVRYRSVLGDYATWNASESGMDFDLRTFEVELVPQSPIEGLRAGMTALIDL
ncbi:HlyD family secretion protein [Ferrimonas sp. SCSIO 43195]|uniref:HlyD family secretion protein n=1 Tax=Ferrimonas sp. SCSIO 43195 TaxID=2822844 RepID=UPI0020763CC9|nr:efflux RND transporter periplasmic adaptor subunit [Ferrimonas sp. SCSIO 43195]USD37259.1 efflux RND transporter periplasmic adaptor subunit [Ferrimonas sp. SCSIO 43195]